VVDGKLIGLIGAKIRPLPEPLDLHLEALMFWNKLEFSFSRVDFQDRDEKRYGFYVAKRLFSLKSVEN